MTALILILELVALYFLSRALTRALFALNILIFRHRSIAVPLLLLLQFPGTVIHELAHLFTAEILGVRTGKLRLEPESIREDAITSGSVMIAETDPFRRYAIGLAPIFWGITILTALSYFLPDLASKGLDVQNIVLWKNTSFYLLLAAGYLIFAVSNTMFPSPEDVSGIWPFLLVFTIFIAAGFFFGLRLQFTGAILSAATQILETLVQSLGIVLGLNIIILSVTGLITQIFMRITHRRIVRN